MSFVTEVQTIQTRFATNWPTYVGGTVQNPLIPVAYENVDFTPPEQSGISQGAWVRLSIRNGDSNQISFGGGDKGLHRAMGLIIVQCFVPEGKGEFLVRQLADYASAIFRSVSMSNGIKTKSPRVSYQGNSGGYYQLNVEVPYWRDEVFS